MFLNSGFQTFKTKCRTYYNFCNDYRIPKLVQLDKVILKNLDLSDILSYGHAISMKYIFRLRQQLPHMLTLEQKIAINIFRLKVLVEYQVREYYIGGPSRNCFGRGVDRNSTCITTKITILFIGVFF